jgi:predicted acyltransferase
MPNEGQPNRLVSLDAFRGLTIASMILVNNPGSGDVYAQLDHAAWNGWTFTDTVFPFFLWIVGLSIVLSTAKRLAHGVPRGELPGRILRRALLLYAFGFFLAGFPFFHLAHIRYLGVLQRIAICYLVSAALFVFTNWKAQAAAVVVLCASYWLLMMEYPVPGVGKGQLGPDGNLARYIDGLVLSGHMWSHTQYWDPEGIVSTLPAIATTLLGCLAGRLLRFQLELRKSLKPLFLFGLSLVAVGMLFDHWLPINKNLWTVSFAFFMSGLATLEFWMLFWIVDVKGWRGWSKPFVIYGMNAIAVFVLSGIVGRLLGLIHVTESNGTAVSLQGFIFEHVFAPVASPRNASLLFAFAMVLFLFAIAWLLYRRRWFLRV